ncbi:MAG: molybdate metabolism regulator, partial [Labilithrix sp.]|nr:molybdate metabolism regulator [Labilithrix sp.]
MRRFELSEGSSNKFWEIAIEGAGYTVRYGKIGSEGQVQTKSFSNEAAALKQAEKVIAEKVGKGYREIAPTGGSKNDAQGSAANSAPAVGELPFSPVQRSLLLPRRGEVEPPKAASLAKLWRAIHEDYLRIDGVWHNSGLPFADRLSDEEPPKGKLDAAHEAACAVAFGVSDAETAPVRPVTAESFVRYWAAKEGPAFVIDAAVHTLDSSRYAYRVRENNRGYSGGKIQIRNRTSGDFHDYAIPGLWGALRRWVATLDDAAYAKARAAAETLQTKKYEKEIENKLVLSFAFPDEPKFALRAADAVLAAESPHTFLDRGVGYLAASLNDVARLEKLIEEELIQIPIAFLPTLARNIGERTPHVLERAFELECLYGKRGPSDRERDVAAIAQATAETIALFASSDAADALARLADAPGAAAIVAEFARVHADLARSALSRHAKKKPESAAAKLLERLNASERECAISPASTTSPPPVRPLTDEELSTDDRIAWTEETRAAALLPRRTPRTTAGWDAIDAPAYAKEIRGYLHATPRFKGALKKSRVDAELWPHVEKLLEGKEGAGTPEAEGVVAALGDFSNDLRQRFSNSHQAMVSVWTARHGVAFALKAVIAWGRLLADGDPFSGPITLKRRAFLEPAWSAPRADVFQRLQLRLMQAPDEQYAEALHAARRIFASAEPSLKGILGFLFPDEASFDTPPSDVDHYLLCASRDPARLGKLAARELENPRWTDWTFSELAVHVPGHLIEVLGMDALPYLQGMRKQVRNIDERYRAPLYEALDRAQGVLEGRTAFATLIAQLGDWSRRPWVWARLTRRPALAVLAALDVLADAKIAPLGREVLAYLQHEHADIAQSLVGKLSGEQRSKLTATRVDSTLPPWLATPPAHWKQVKTPSFVSTHTLPRIALRNGGTLSPAHVETVRLVMTHGQGAAQVELSQLRAAATPESLDAFAIAVLHQWLDAKAPPKEKWAMISAAHLGG